MVSKLLAETSLQLYASCMVLKDLSGKKRARTAACVSCKIDITVYGPRTLLDEIGPRFRDYGVSLQDPVESHHDVQYLNPQKPLPEDLDNCLTVSEFISQNLSVLQSIPERPDMLDLLSNHISLEEAEQPAAIRTELKRYMETTQQLTHAVPLQLLIRRNSHQKQALTFMLQREQGWSFDRSPPDMWELIDSGLDQLCVGCLHFLPVLHRVG